MAGNTLDLGNLLCHMRMDASQYNSAISKVTAKMKSLTAMTKRYAKIATVAIGTQMVLSVKAFASFEEQMANVSTMLDEHSMKYMPAYERALKSMAIEFGESTKTLSKGLYDILSASVDASKAIGVLKVSVKAAKAGMTDTGTAADALTTIINSYGLAAEDAGKVSDILFAIVKKGKTTFAELAPQIGMVASVASTAGLSLEEMGAALATMTRAGLRTRISVTALRGIMTSFIKPTDDAKAAAETLGLELNSTTLRTIGLTGVLEKLKDAQPELVAAIFPNVRALTGMSAMLKQTKEHAEDLRFMLHATGLTQQAYEKMTGILAHTLRRLWQVIKIVSVGVGERLAPGIKTLTEKIIENKRIIEDWAVAFADRIVFVGQVLRNLLVFMKTNWKAGFGLVLNILVSMLETTAKVMINLAIRMGKGIWAGVKAGLESAFGGGVDEKELQARIWKRYYLMVREQQRIFAEQGMGKVPEATVPRMKQFMEGQSALYKKMRRTIIAEMEEESRGVLTKSVFAGFREYAGQQMKGFLEDVKSMEAKMGVDIWAGPAADLYRKDFIRKAKYMWESIKLSAGKTLDFFERMGFPLRDIFNFTKGTKEQLEKVGETAKETAKELKTLTEDEINLLRTMYGEMGRMTLKEYKFRIEMLDKEFDKFIAITGNELMALKWRAEQVRKLDLEFDRASDSMKDGFIAATEEMKHNMQIFGEMGYQVAQELENAFATAFEGMIMDARRWRDVLKSFLDSVLRSLVRIQARQMATQLMVGIGALFAHRGGVVGAGMPTQQVPAMAFAGAPRLHAGLAADEFPAVLQRGETVIPKGGAAPTVVINNNTGQRMEQEGAPKFDGKAWVVGIITEEINQYGSLRHTIQGMG